MEDKTLQNERHFNTSKMRAHKRSTLNASHKHLGVSFHSVCKDMHVTRSLNHQVSSKNRFPCQIPDLFSCSFITSSHTGTLHQDAGEVIIFWLSVFSTSHRRKKMFEQVGSRLQNCVEKNATFAWYISQPRPALRATFVCKLCSLITGVWRLFVQWHLSPLVRSIKRHSLAY